MRILQVAMNPDGTLKASAVGSASSISFTPTGSISSTDVQAAIAELLAEGVATTAAAVTIADAANDFAATNVETALAELQAADELDDQALVDHLADPTAAHAATAISFTPAGTIAATTVQAAIEEVATEGAATTAVAVTIADAANDFTATNVETALAELQTRAEADDAALAAHLADTTDAHAGTALTNTPAGAIAATTVQAAINELDAEKQPIDPTLTALSAQNWVANSLPVGTGADTLAQTNFTANTFVARASTGNLGAKAITDFGLSLVDDADATTARTTIGAAATVHVHTGEDITSGTVADARIAATIARDSEVAAGYQPLDTDLTAVAALAPANDDILQRKSGVWTNRTMAQLTADLSAVTSNTCGYVDWSASPTTFPTNAFAYAGVSGGAYADETAAATLEALTTIRETLVYKSVHQIQSVAGTAGTDPAFDWLSDNSASALRQQFIENVFADTLYLTEGAVVYTDSFGCKQLNLSMKNAQLYCAIALRATCRRLGATSLFIDTFSDSIYGPAGVAALGGISSLPDQVTSDQVWEDYFVLPFAAAVFPALRADGIRIIINGGGYRQGAHLGSEGSYDRGDSRMRWMEQMAPFVDGFAHEFPFEGSDDDPLEDSIAVTGTALTYKSWLSYNDRIPAKAEALGKGYYQFVSGTAQNLRYSHASALLAWNGTVPFATMDFRGAGTADTSPTWRWATGFPKRGRPAQRVDVRTQANGVSALNSATVTVDSTTGFETVGGFRAGTTIVTYTGKTGTTFTGCSAHPAIADNAAVQSTLAYIHKRQYDNGTVLRNSDPTTSHTYSGTAVASKDATFVVGSWL